MPRSPAVPQPSASPSAMQPAMNDIFLPVKTWRGYVLVSSALLPPSHEETARIYPDHVSASPAGALAGLASSCDSPCASPSGAAPARPAAQPDDVLPLPDAWIDGYFSRYAFDFSLPEIPSGYTDVPSIYFHSPTPDDEAPMRWPSILSAPYEFDDRMSVDAAVPPPYMPNGAAQAGQLLLDPSPGVPPGVSDVGTTTLPCRGPR